MRRTRGFTLIELLLVLIIIGVLLGSALPSFHKTLAASRARETLQTLSQSIEFARIAAITKASTVTLCKSEDSLTCSGDWNDGIIVFTDQNRNRKIDQDDELLRSIEFTFATGEIKWRAFQNKQYLQMTSQGFTHYQNGNFTYCPVDKNPAIAHQIIINRLGRIRWATDSDGDGIREDSQGRPLNCST